MEELVAAMQDVCARYDQHCKAAEEIARGYFDSDVVLKNLLSQVGL